MKQKTAFPGLGDIPSLLPTLADPQYREFAARLLPGLQHPLLGVRLPVLRKLARQLADDDWRSFLDNAADTSFEEIMLQGMVIGCLHADPEEILSRSALFIPKMDNWSVCDSFCSSLHVAKRERERVWNFVCPYTQAGETYAVRFAAVMLLHYYITADYLPEVLRKLAAIRHPAYYARMAVAWGLSVCCVRFPEQTLALLERRELDADIQSKTLRKILESRQIPAVTRKRILALQRPRAGNLSVA